MLGFLPLGAAPLSALISGLSATIITATPPALTAFLGQPSDPIEIDVTGTFEGAVLFESSRGSMIQPAFLHGSGTVRVTPAQLGLDTITISNTDGAINPGPVSLTVIPAVIPPNPNPPTLTIRGFVRNRAGVLRRNLSGLEWAYWDAQLPSMLGPPMDQGSDAGTDAQGAFVLTVRSDLDVADIGYLIVSDGAGNIAFAGQVTLSA